MYNIKRQLRHLRLLEHKLNGKKSFKSDDEMTNLGGYDWLCKTPVWLCRC